MRRAILPILLLCAIAVVQVPAAWPQGSPLIINGIGLIDYGRPPDFKIGTWTRYRVTGHSIKGRSDDYELTIGIAGEERLWGEDCFWVETSMVNKLSGTSSIATLMSYSVFEDSLPFSHMQYFTRKNITETDAMGNPDESIARRPPPSVRDRNTNAGRNLSVHIDTLGTDTLTVSKGKFVCKRIQIRQDLGVEVERGDSTSFSETRDHRDSYVSREVPLTGIVREDIDFTSTLKTWMAGRSKDAATNTVSQSTGQAVLVDFGDDYKGFIIAEWKRHSLRDQDRAAAHSAAPSPPQQGPKRH